MPLAEGVANLAELSAAVLERQPEQLLKNLFYLRTIYRNRMEMAEQYSENGEPAAAASERYHAGSALDDLLALIDRMEEVFR
jgi:hypothetical protein